MAKQKKQSTPDGLNFGADEIAYLLDIIKKDQFFWTQRSDLSRSSYAAEMFKKFKRYRINKDLEKAGDNNG